MGSPLEKRGQRLRKAAAHYEGLGCVGRLEKKGENLTVLIDRLNLATRRGLVLALTH